MSECPKCTNENNNILTNFGREFLCGLCRNVWPVLDRWL